MEGQSGEGAYERDQSWLRAFSRILAKLRKLPDAQPFLAPVDFEGLGLPDYVQVFEIIEMLASSCHRSSLQEHLRERENTVVIALVIP